MESSSSEASNLAAEPPIEHIAASAEAGMQRPAIAKLFDCHDLLAMVARHLLPAPERFRDGSRHWGQGGGVVYVDVRNFIFVSKNCRDAGNEALYSEISLSRLGVDAPMLLMLTLQRRPDLAQLVRVFDCTGLRDHSATARTPVFGQRAEVKLLEIMPQISAVRMHSGDATEWLLERGGASRLEYLDLTIARDRGGWVGEDTWGNPLIGMSAAGVRLVTSTSQVILSGPSERYIGLVHAGEIIEPKTRALHLRECNLHPSFIHDLLPHLDGAITSLTIEEPYDAARYWTGPVGTAPLWRDVIDALQQGLQHLRVSDRRLRVWRMDLSHLVGLRHLELDLKSANMPDTRLLPPSLESLRIVALGEGQSLRALLEALAQKDLLPSLRAIPHITRDPPEPSYELSFHEETIFAARDIALKRLRSRGLHFMPRSSERCQQIWHESAKAYRAAVASRTAASVPAESPFDAWSNGHAGMDAAAGPPAAAGVGDVDEDDGAPWGVAGILNPGGNGWAIEGGAEWGVAPPPPPPPPAGWGGPPPPPPPPLGPPEW